MSQQLRSPSFIRPHHSKLVAISRAMDWALIVGSLYVALRYYNLHLDIQLASQYFLPCLIGSGLYGIISENNELYQGWRGASLFDESVGILLSWLGAFIILVSGMYFLALNTLTHRKSWRYGYHLPLPA